MRSFAGFLEVPQTLMKKNALFFKVLKKPEGSGARFELALTPLVALGEQVCRLEVLLPLFSDVTLLRDLFSRQNFVRFTTDFSTTQCICSQLFLNHAIASVLKQCMNNLSNLQSVSQLKYWLFNFYAFKTRPNTFWSSLLPLQHILKLLIRVLRVSFSTKFL